MAEAGVGFITLKPDFSKFSGKDITRGIDPGLDQTDKHVTSKMGGTFRSVAALGAGLLGAQVVGGFAKGIVSAASSMDETLSKSNIIFGSSAKEIENWASTAATSFGQSKQQALDAASGFGNLFTQLGVGAGEAAKMSKAQTELASDFASFYDDSPEEAINAMSAAYRGEFDALQKYVPKINAAAVEQKALEMGLAGSTKELTAQDKALATQSIIMEQAGAAAGNFDLTSAGLANTQRTLAGVWEDTQATLGQKLLPVVTAVAGFLADKLPVALDLAGQAFRRVSDFIAPFAEAARGVYDILFRGDFTGGIFGLQEDSSVVDVLFRIREAFLEVVDFFRGEVVPRVKEVADAFGEGGIGGALSKVGEIVSNALPAIQVALGKVVSAFIDWVAEVAPPLLRELGSLLLSIGTWITTTALPAIVDQLAEWAGALVDWVGPKIMPLLEELGKVLAALGTWLKDTALPKIQEKLAEWGGAFVAWVGPKILPLLAALVGLLSAVGSWIIDTGLPLIVNKMREWGGAFVDWVVPKIPLLIAALALLLAGLVYWVITTALPNIINKLGEWAGAFIGWVPGALVDLLSKLGVFLIDLGIWIVTKGVPKLVKMGLDLAAGLIKGLLDKLRELPGAIGDFLSGIKLPSIKAPDWFPGGDGPGAPSKSLNAGVKAGSTLKRVQGALTAGTYVTSTYRSPAQNASVGGSPTSYHMDKANPAVDIGGSTSALNTVASKLRSMGGWRELLWQVKGHYDHLHVAHAGGSVTPQGITPLRSDELLTKLQVGETVLPRDFGGTGGLPDPDAWGRQAARAYASEIRLLGRTA